MLSEVTEVFVGTKLFIISILVSFSEIIVTPAFFPERSLISFKRFPYIPDNKVED